MSWFNNWKRCALDYGAASSELQCGSRRPRQISGNNRIYERWQDFSNANENFLVTMGYSWRNDPRPASRHVRRVAYRNSPEYTNVLGQALDAANRCRPIAQTYRQGRQRRRPSELSIAAWMRTGRPVKVVKLATDDHRSQDSISTRSVFHSASGRPRSVARPTSWLPTRTTASST